MLHTTQCSPDSLPEYKHGGPRTDRHKPDKLPDDVLNTFVYNCQEASHLSAHSECGASGSRRAREEVDMSESEEEVDMSESDNPSPGIIIL